MVRIESVLERLTTTGPQGQIYLSTYVVATVEGFVGYTKVHLTEPRSPWEGHALLKAASLPSADPESAAQAAERRASLLFYRQRAVEINAHRTITGLQESLKAYGPLIIETGARRCIEKLSPFARATQHQ